MSDTPKNDGSNFTPEQYAKAFRASQKKKPKGGDSGGSEPDITDELYPKPKMTDKDVFQKFQRDKGLSNPSKEAEDERKKSEEKRIQKLHEDHAETIRRLNDLMYQQGIHEKHQKLRDKVISQKVGLRELAKLFARNSNPGTDELVKTMSNIDRLLNLYRDRLRQQQQQQQQQRERSRGFDFGL